MCSIGPVKERSSEADISEDYCCKSGRTSRISGLSNLYFILSFDLSIMCKSAESHFLDSVSSSFFVLENAIEENIALHIVIPGNGNDISWYYSLRSNEIFRK
jgi:hypothetical protein